MNAEQPEGPGRLESREDVAGILRNPAMRAQYYAALGIPDPNPLVVQLPEPLSDQPVEAPIGPPEELTTTVILFQHDDQLLEANTSTPPTESSDAMNMENTLPKRRSVGKFLVDKIIDGIMYCAYIWWPYDF